MSYAKILMLAGLVSFSAIGASSAWADDTTTTTTTRTQKPAEPGVVVGVPGVVGVEVGKGPADPGCAHHKTTTTNEDSGTSVTTKETNC
ncbi:MAG TPA: hypothetical protein VH414_08945 [Lichenihabitans sp.]|jgi:hypothetical protein|nr:hypothetical protein [Lichenihabitans sp.]